MLVFEFQLILYNFFKIPIKWLNIEPNTIPITKMMCFLNGQMVTISFQMYVVSCRAGGDASFAPQDNLVWLNICISSFSSQITFIFCMIFQKCFILNKKMALLPIISCIFFVFILVFIRILTLSFSTFLLSFITNII